jgi:hypothetical protein
LDKGGILVEWISKNIWGTRSENYNR